MKDAHPNDPTQEEIWSPGGLADQERWARHESHRREYNQYEPNNRGEPLCRVPQELRHLDILR